MGPWLVGLGRARQAGHVRLQDAHLRQMLDAAEAAAIPTEA